MDQLVNLAGYLLIVGPISVEKGLVGAERESNKQRLREKQTEVAHSDRGRICPLNNITMFHFDSVLLCSIYCS